MPRLQGFANIGALELQIAAATTAEHMATLQRRRLQAAHRQAEHRVRQQSKIALLILCLTEGNIHAARTYLEKSSLPPTSESFPIVVEHIQQEYADATADKRQAWLDDTTCQGMAAARQAKKFLNEYSVHQWLEQQNLDRGFTPAPSCVLDKFKNVLHHDAPPVSRPVSAKDKQWLRRWRMRWGVRSGCIPCRERVSPADCRAKAVYMLQFHCRSS